MLFDKAIIFTDIHYGLKNNSKDHNDDCSNFIDYMIEVAKERDIKTCIFMGDFFHNRSNVNISTLDYGLKAMHKLNDNFDVVYFLVGNHDMYHKNDRDVTSVNMANVFTNIKFINTITTIDDCTFIPFLIEDEYLQLQSLTSKYVFGHLELPGYLLNKMVEMPDHGKENEDSFSGCEYVFSGHFHKRQQRIAKSGTKIIYTGNCFPHNFSDAWDDLRGMTVLEYDKVPEFITWDNAPKYRKFNISDMLENPSFYLDSNTIAKAVLDIDLTMEQIDFIRSMVNTHYNVRDFGTIAGGRSGFTINNTDYDEDDEDEDMLGSGKVDDLVLLGIDKIDSDSIDKELLKDIYINL